MKKSEYVLSIRRIFDWSAAITIILLGLIMIFSSGCAKDDPITDPDPDPITEPTNHSITDQFGTADNSGVLELDGYKLELTPGSIPSLANGNPATVTFSIETDVDLPKAMPNGMDQVGKAVHFGPEGFIFQSPLLVKFPLPESHTPDRVSIVYYNDQVNDWQIVPTTYIDLENREIGAYVLSLDYFTLANVENINKTANERLSGGIRWNLSHFPNNSVVPPGWIVNDTYFILTVKTFESRYDDDHRWTDPIGWIGMTQSDYGSSAIVGSPWHSQGIEMYVPQGSYTLWISAQTRTLAGDILTMCYSIPATVNVDQSVECSWTSCQGWSTIDIEAGGTWFDEGEGGNRFDPCDVWPDPTIPVCTGDFQATLTWTNKSNEMTDLDLHLYGPNGLNIYHANTNPGGNGQIMLDRDIISQVGDVQENICAPALYDMPKGNYRIAVQHYSGAQKNFQVRLVRGGKSDNYSGTINSSTSPNAVNTSKPEITVFEFTLD